MASTTIEHRPLAETRPEAVARGRLSARLGLALAVGLLLTSPAQGQSAEDLIPFKKLPVKLRKELWKVAKSYTVRRKAPDREVVCESRTFHYLLRRLPLASRLVREMKLGEYVIKDAPSADGKRGFSISDEDGAFANCRIVFQEADRIVIVARGYVESGLFPKVYGTGVIIIRTTAGRENGQPKVTADTRVYFRLRDDNLHHATKAFRKTLGRVIGARLAQFLDCAATLAGEIHKSPRKVDGVMVKLGVPAEELGEYRRRVGLPPGRAGARDSREAPGKDSR